MTITNIESQLGNNGITLFIADNSGTHQGKLRIRPGHGRVVQGAHPTRRDRRQVLRATGQPRRYVHPLLGARLVASEAETAAEPDPLSEREHDVLRLLALGHTNQEIAKMLFISVRTAETHTPSDSWSIAIITCTRRVAHRGIQQRPLWFSHSAETPYATGALCEGWRSPLASA